MPLPIIALEEHFFAQPDLLSEAIQEMYKEQLKFVPSVLDNLRDLDTRRQAAMKTAGVTLQVISHAPGLCSSNAAAASKVNDYLATEIKNKNQFRGFATLPMIEPENAAVELRRCVKELGFVGALIDNHIVTPGSGEPRYYDGPEFRCVFKAAQDLGVPIYLHPTFPTGSLARHYDGSFIPAAAQSMGSSGWGWHSECGLHVLRLFAAGVFDKFPRLKIIVGHFGEMLPAMVGRVQHLSRRWGERQRDFATVYKENIWLTTSGVWNLDPMGTIAMNTGVEKVLFSIDWPFANETDGKKFWEDLCKSGIYDEDALERIAWKNSAALFKLDESAVMRTVADQK